MKLVVPEQGSEGALAAWGAADRVLSSQLLYPEARSALGRAARSGRLGRDEVPAARALVERLWRDLDRLGLTESLARQAGELADERGLRGYDAVHLASALSVADPGTVVVAADGELLAAARALGLATAAVG